MQATCFCADIWGGRCLESVGDSLPPWNLFFIHLFLAVLGLCCCVGFSLVVASWCYSLVVVCRLLIAVASLVAEHRF